MSELVDVDISLVRCVILEFRSRFLLQPLSRDKRKRSIREKHILSFLRLSFYMLPYVTCIDLHWWLRTPATLIARILRNHLSNLLHHINMRHSTCAVDSSDKVRLTNRETPNQLMIRTQCSTTKPSHPKTQKPPLPLHNSSRSSLEMIFRAPAALCKTAATSSYRM